MEVVRSCRTANNLDISRLHLGLKALGLILITIVIRKMEESFDSALAVLRSLPIHAMGK